MSSYEAAYRAAIENPDIDVEDAPSIEPMTTARAKEILEPGQFHKFPPSGKYNARRVVYNCHERGVLVFASDKEFSRYLDLLRMEQAGEICNLALQRTFELFPKKDGLAKETYTCDFFYERMADGREVVEDVKGKRLPLFALKWRVMREKFPRYEYIES